MVVIPPASTPAELASALLHLSLAGTCLLRPVYYSDSEHINDLAWVQLNPAAQRMLRLPECPAESFLTCYPTAVAAGVFAFYCDAFQSGQVAHRQNGYLHDGLDGYYSLAAQRVGDYLLVSFTDANDQPRSALEEELRTTRAQEQAARAEAEARQAELRAVFEQAPVAIALLQGPTYVVEFANARMARIWDRPLAAIVGQPHFTALPDLAGQGFEALFDDVFRTGETRYFQELEVTFTPAGQPYQGYFNVTYQPSYDAQGQRKGIVASAIDVTGQVLARRQVDQLNQQLEAARQQAERERNLLQALLTQVPVAISLFQGEELRVTAVNAQMAALWGHAPAQVLHKPLLEGVPELQGQGFDDLLRQVLATQVPVTGTEAPAQLLRNGQLRTTYYNFVYQPLYDAEGRVLGVIDVAVEVTEQVEARRQIEQLNQELEARVQQRTQQLEAQQQQVQATFEQAPVAIFVLQGPTHVLRVVNRAMSELLGQPAAALLGQSLAQALPAVAPPGYLDLLAQVWRTGEPVTVAESPARLPHHAPGETGYYTFVYHPLRDAQAQTTNIMCVAVEVTDQVLARQQVQQLNQKLAAINEELLATNQELHASNARLTRTNTDLDTFVYTASHDLKAPITNIEGILAALRETLPAAVQQDEVVAHLLGLLDHTVGRFLNTIFQLTDVSRLQQTYNEPAEQLALAPVVADVLADLAPQVTAAQAQVQVDVPAGLQVSFAPASLRSVVYNLLSNALKYRDPARPAQVWLQATGQAGQVVLTVRDNGLGLTETQQQRLFGVFQRLHTHVEGTGVGLYMIKRLLDNAGATIAVTSTPGVGSTFTVTLPA